MPASGRAELHPFVASTVYQVLDDASHVEHAAEVLVTEALFSEECLVLGPVDWATEDEVLDQFVLVVAVKPL
jgi:hypothetical protein